ncbi:RNA polymerase sigma-70 factor [Bacteroides pyogenes F0041]|uniref:RNA polymerase sigma-70 factor n=1 Tax=Bacteroides pyogenes F0041 TaxID=1321819 RepID=U2CWF1_9BACE|nr:sigma-70 family RNA polymerase sigma factor [Bacteroides pyogenes]ERI88388.1 RNA polymerase sigma-70 factor [Bacteroides pyogenes F0041]MBB3896519.1 RNA polymerase sigma-70 factor (ECF subfamily) [Bacteroides pyogenes]GAE23886.1 RNA polymerase ECF-type sigma factor [Bacteroides pyogenes JCM 10003]SUV31276.1 RNA polymerase ECF-type sigma factor [Bacteroides pyogenes]
MSQLHQDEWIITQLTTNFNEGFRLMFLAYYAPLKRIAGRIVGSDFAEDAVQDIFTKIWTNRICFGNISSLKSYLYTSIQNQCLNVLRKNGLLENYKEALQNGHWEESILDEEVFIRLYEAIDRLPEHYREAMIKTLKGESIAKIASSMNATEDMVKAYKRRAKELLKKQLCDITLIYK